MFSLILGRGEGVMALPIAHSKQGLIQVFFFRRGGRLYCVIAWPN